MTGLQGAQDVAAGDPDPQPGGRRRHPPGDPRVDPGLAGTKDLVARIRAAAADASARYGITVYVTGTTAVNIDVSDKLSPALPTFLVLIVVLALVLLLVVFRSFVVPVKAAAGFLFSIAASLGVTVWVFQDGHLGGLLNVSGTGPIVSFLPVLLIGILFGLAMDCEVCLVSRSEWRQPVVPRTHSG